MGRLRERQRELAAVEGHLACAYAKLGIEGRGQLARALAPGKH